MVATQDQKMSVWDIRMFKELHSRYMRGSPRSVSISEHWVDRRWVETLQATIWKGLFSDNKADLEKTYIWAWGGEGQTPERFGGCHLKTVSA